MPAEKKPAGGAGMREPKPAGGEREDGSEKGGMSVHDHGDGTAHTEIAGKREEHPDHMHAVAHVAHHLMPEGEHFHAHHDGFTSKSHGIHESGEHQETQEHGSPEELHGAMDQMMGGGEGQEGGEGAPAEAEGGPGMMSGLG